MRLLTTLFFLFPPIYMFSASWQADAELNLQMDSYRVVLAPKHQTVLSSSVTTRVKETPKKMGENFVEGDLLVRLDDLIFRANVKKAQAVQERAQTELSAKEELFKDNVASFFELKDAMATLAVAEADLAVAQQELEGCSLLAPYTGKIVQLYVDDHEMVQPGQALVEIVDDSLLIARLLIPSLQLPKLKIAKVLNIHIRETGETIQARITQIGSVIDPASSMVKVDAEIDNSKGNLRAGMIGTTRLGNLDQLDKPKVLDAQKTKEQRTTPDNEEFPELSLEIPGS
ncbi:MAG: hypothetical protein CMO81_01945 [Waddliaceae bacterium]|nr:hypothetical protein [Waddliaceae bacterium]